MIWSHDGGIECAKVAIRLQVSHSHPWTWACMRGKMRLKPAPPLVVTQNIDAYLSMFVIILECVNGVAIKSRPDV